MGYEFTVEQIQEVVRATRVYCPGFSEEQFQNLLLMKGRLIEAGYLEAVGGLAELEKEGTPTTQALKENKALLRRNTELERKINNSQMKWQSLEETNRKAEAELIQKNEATQKAKKELEDIRADRAKENRELAEFRLATAKEKERLEREVDEYREKAKITEEEIIVADQIKAEIETHGFTLELVLTLAQEFGAHEKACEELAREIQKHQTVRGCITTLEQQFHEHQKALQVELEKFSAQEEKRLIDIKSQEATYFYLKNSLSKLQADQAYEEEIRRFYKCYWKVSGLIECLASWDKIYFYRCHNPLSAMAGFFNPEVNNAYFWTDKKVAICPHCGFNLFNFDEKPYLVLGAQVGEPLKIVLGE